MRCNRHGTGGFFSFFFGVATGAGLAGGVASDGVGATVLDNGAEVGAGVGTVTAGFTDGAGSTDPFRLRHFLTLALCSSSVEAKAWPPVPLATK